MGEMRRAVNIAYHYGMRLNGNRERIMHLIEDYPTHTFVIDYDEASDEKRTTDDQNRDGDREGEEEPEGEEFQITLYRIKETDRD
jgi:hypothetical protein